MKKILLFLFCFTSVATGFSQTGYPATTYQYIPYQGIARNATGQPLANTTIYTFTVITNYDAVNLYAEYRTVTTNQFGLFNMQVGSAGATPSPGNTIGFDDLRWDKMISPEMLVNIRLGTTGSYTRIATVPLASVPFAQMAARAKPWKYGNTANPSISPDLSIWKLGLGTDTATEKLHVVGKFRLVDGNQGAGKLLTSDANGVATWQSPAGGGGTTSPNYFTLDQNNVGAGINTLSLTDTTRGLVVGTKGSIAGGPGLWVDGPLRFTNTGYFGVGSATNSENGDVLTSDAQGFARWAKPGGPWSTGASGSVLFPGNAIKPTDGVNLPVLVNTKMVVQPTNTLGGDWEDRKNYPLAIDNPNGTHGMSISLNGGVEHDRKYITFFENAGVKGRIEGQDLNDLRETPEWKTDFTIKTLQGAEFAAEGVACAAQVDVAEVACMILQAAIWAADFGTNLTNLEGSVGITYASGSGDYAEWLERANPADKFTFGDIVSVKGGKIYRDLTNGGQLMVISRAPIVLGNMPAKGREALYEKVAFIGQVPVKVQGAVAVGDYIVATAGSSGIGYAVHHNKITTEEYSRIVGVAWQAYNGSFLSIVNTAIGVNTSAANSIIKKQEEKIALLENQFNQLSAYLQSKDPSYQYTKLETKPVTATSDVKNPLATFSTPANKAVPATFKMFSTMSATDQIKFADETMKDKIRKILNEQPEYIDAAMKSIKEKIEATDTDADPKIKRILNDRAFFIETIKKAYNI